MQFGTRRIKLTNKNRLGLGKLYSGRQHANRRSGLNQYLLFESISRRRAQNSIRKPRKLCMQPMVFDCARYVEKNRWKCATARTTPTIRRRRWDLWMEGRARPFRNARNQHPWRWSWRDEISFIRPRGQRRYIWIAHRYSSREMRECAMPESVKCGSSDT